MNHGGHRLFNILEKGGKRSGFVWFRALEPGSGIDGGAHGTAFLRSEDRGLLAGEPVNPVAGPRIGISRATDLLWRFGDPASRSLSWKF